ncbi:UNVERIFIED_CONTAM: hypothetical protein K2H54_036077 [Gekko kuhli]
MTPEKFKHHIIEMIVKNSLPLSFISQTAFLGLNGEMAKKLGVSLERESIRKLIIEEAKRKKEELQEVLKGCFVFLKMDACTRHRVNYFAINVRFVDENNKTITRTLGLKDTQAHHTSDYLQKLVEGVLEDLEIKKEQILCVVTDNASNMLSTIEKMNADEEGNKQILELEEDSSASIGESLETEENADIFLDNFVEEALKLATIHHMRCTVQDGLKDRHAATLIGKLREQTATGGKALYDVAVCMKGLRPEIPPQDEVLLSNSGNSGSSSSNEELDFDSFLNKMEVAKRKRRYISVTEPVNVQIKRFQQEFYKVLEEVKKYDRSSKLTVEEAILVYPEIVSDVARIVTAMPPTQVSAKRLFSALKIMSDLRASMKENVAEAILFLRTLH